jgi:2-oxoglutarate ferredoxin oxidoreductase subunit beta
MQSLESLGHDPADRLAALALAQDYGDKLYTGVFYRKPEPEPTFEALAKQRHAAFAKTPRPRHAVMDVFRLAK